MDETRIRTITDAVEAVLRGEGVSACCKASEDEGASTCCEAPGIEPGTCEAAPREGRRDTCCGDAIAAPRVVCICL